MNKILAFAAVAAITAVAVPAFAADGSTNASIGYSNYSVGHFSPGAISGTVGWNQGYFGVEGEAAAGVQSDKFTDTAGSPAVNETARLNSEFGVFATGQVEASKDFDLFARVGYATADFHSTNKPVGGTATNSSASGSGFAYGAGAQYMFDGVDGIRGAYNVYDLGVGSSHGHGGDNADVWSVAFVRKFK